MNPPRVDYLTPEEHYREASRLLLVVERKLQPAAEQSIADLAVVALAHAATALAGGVSDGSATRRLDRIRALLAGFDWELGANRVEVLDAVDRIVKGERP